MDETANPSNLEETEERNQEGRNFRKRIRFVRLPEIPAFLIQKRDSSDSRFSGPSAGTP